MHKNYLWVIIAILIVALLLVWLTDKKETPPEQENPVACTLDAKICPDGTAVGRVGPNCEFAACPGE